MKGGKKGKSTHQKKKKPYSADSPTRDENKSCNKGSKEIMQCECAYKIQFHSDFKKGQL